MTHLMWLIEFHTIHGLGFHYFKLHQARFHFFGNDTVYYTHYHTSFKTDQMIWLEYVFRPDKTWQCPIGVRLKIIALLTM